MYVCESAGLKRSVHFVMSTALPLVNYISHVVKTCISGFLRTLPFELRNTAYNTVLVSVSVFMALSTVFHSINSPGNSPFSHSVLVVLVLPYWSFELYISL